MIKYLLFAALALNTSVNAQVFPANLDTINFTEILFTFPEQDDADSYAIEISESSTFDQKQIYEVSINATILKTFSFGKNYYWRYKGLGSKSKNSDWSKTNSFYIAGNDFTDSNLYRYNGRKKKRNLVGPGLLFMDYGRVAVNRGGKIVWRLPGFPFLKKNDRIRDLKITKEGTITGILNQVACEFDLKGNIIWRAPDNGIVSGEEREYYHHDLKKLDDGNYMVLGMDNVKRLIPNTNDSLDIAFGTVIEYNKDGEVVWSWNSKDYFTDNDLFSRKRSDNTWDVNTHMNAFSTDGENVYVGFRDISRIIVIDKASKRVVQSYGSDGNISEPHYANGFFRRQHDAYKLKDGNFAVVNNDSIMDPNVVSSLVIFTPGSRESESKLLLDFKFDFDTLTNGKSAKMGNLQELDNTNILVNMGAINRCFEVTRDGEVVWNMFMEKYDINLKKWRACPQYRVSFTKCLHPYVFRLKVLEDKVVDNKRKLKIKVFNIGGMDDSYTLKCINKKNGEILKKTTSQILKSESTGEISFSFDSGDYYELVLESNNSGLNSTIK